MVKLRRIFAAALIPLLTLGAAPAAKPEIGQIAPHYKLKLMDGTTVDSDDLRGKVVVLNFWATWCVPCRKELPELDAYYNVQHKYGLEVYAVTTEGSLPAYKMKSLFKVLHIHPARYIRGPYGAMDGVPTNFVIGRDGRLRYAKAGALNLDSMNRILVPLLREPAPDPKSPDPKS